jgi:hypothetical protein
MHVAQLNIARLLAPVEDPLLADFVANLEAVNATAESWPGFVWRLADDGTLSMLEPGILMNMSVWTSVDALREYTYRSSHLEMLRRRREWFSHEGLDQWLVLWWIPVGHVPTVDEARERLAVLRRVGPGPSAFTLRQPFPASATTSATIDA